MRKFFFLIIVACLVTPVAKGSIAPQAEQQGQAAIPVTTHPRLWITEADLPRLRQWATASNPLYQDGLRRIATTAKGYMDTNVVPGQDNGGSTYSPYYTESYAMLFAFLSLVENDPAVRADYAQRSRTLLMYVMDRAVLGPADGQPFRSPSFATSDRSRWVGHNFALTVDWIYPTLTAQDKATIRTVFLRWASENMEAYPLNQEFHTVDSSLVNDPSVLDLDDPQRSVLRYGANNYYMAHMRNNGLMALAFDEADDPNQQLRAYLRSATGFLLYTQDYMYREDARGGLSPEGFEYMPSMGFPLQLLLALHTAGQNDPTVWGPQVELASNPFWNNLIPAFLHSISPVPVQNPNFGQVYQPAWYGDGERYFLTDMIGIFGPLGVYAHATNAMHRLNQVRWIQTNTPPGGSARLLNRARSQEDLTGVILYFLLFDPTVTTAPDPRPSLPLTTTAPGLGRMMSRTDWTGNATWFNYKLSWNRIDHQHADGNMFDFYRKGEWLTKERTGYGATIGSSDYKNTLTVQNDPAVGSTGSARYIHALRGSQFILNNPAGDPTVVAQSSQPQFAYVLGDATNLYNAFPNPHNAADNYTDVDHVSRSIVWLKPDYLVIYDRAETQTAGRFKRFWLNVPNLPSVNGNVATATTDSGQHLYVTTLLPQAFTTAVITQDATLEPWALADYDPMESRLRIDATGGPANTRFLHVLQGADAGVSASPATLIQQTSGTPFAGTVISQTAILFPVDIDVAFTSLTYRVPLETHTQIITGLTPHAGYTVTTQSVSGMTEVQITPGGTHIADHGGVLTVGMGDLRLVWIPLVQR